MEFFFCRRKKRGGEEQTYYYTRCLVTTELNREEKKNFLIEFIICIQMFTKYDFVKHRQQTEFRENNF